MPDVGGIQLLPETRKKIEVKLPGQNRLLILSIVALVLIIGLYFVLLTYRQSLFSSLTSIDAQIVDLDKSRNREREARILDLNQQLSVINPLINSHTFWSDAFIKIRNLVQPQVQFQTISADALGKKILIVANAANYTTIARQIASFYTIDSVTDILLSRVQSLPTGRLEFIMQLSFDPNKMLIKK